MRRGKDFIYKCDQYKKYLLNSIGILGLVSAILFSESFTIIKVQAKETRFLIYWTKDRLLTWDDYKGKNKTNSKKWKVTENKITTAVTDANVIFSKPKEINSQLRIDVSAIFHKKNSWVNREYNVSKLLEHEQLHFDITELFARKLRKRFLEVEWKGTRKEIVAQYRNLYEENFQEVDKFHDLYDKETEHSLNQEKQQEWNERVARELKELEEYADPVIIIKLKE